MRDAIKKCFDHILVDHQTKGHVTLIGAAIGEVYQMELQIARDRQEIASAHNALTKLGVPEGDLESRVNHLVSHIRELEESLKRVSEQ